MSIANDFVIKTYDFSAAMINEFQNISYSKDLWPIVYILSDRSIFEAYVGETTDTYARMSSHLKSKEKNKLTTVHFISGEKFNKSATLDIESNLIKYISGDGRYKLLNSNVGLANHNYYQKSEVYWDIFQSIWNNLRTKGISNHSIEYINNSDLFKYSPYKTLSNDQKDSLVEILKSLLNKEFKSVVIEGGAGTGKTILAVFLFKLLNSNIEDFNLSEFGDEDSEFIKIVLEVKKAYPNPSMALVIPMSSFRTTIKKVFKNIKGLNAKMVIGPAEVIKEKFDIVVVDESHRLRHRVNLGTYFSAFDKVCGKLNLDKNKCSELDWILKQSRKSILFYDEDQSIKPSDAKQVDFQKLKSAKSTKIQKLKSQFRVKGGLDYIGHIDKLLKCDLGLAEKKFISNKYEFVLFSSIEEMVKQIKLKNTENGLSRLIAGYSWKWTSSKDKKLFDIKIENLKLRWNSVSVDWVNTENSINEVGCIHTTQGYDLNYAGVIFGNEITYDRERNEILIIKENYFDTNGKNSIVDPKELKDFIVNIYRTIMLRGIKGTYVYVCDKNLREYFSKFIPVYKKEEIIANIPTIKKVRFENSVPFYDLRAAAGSFSELQEISEIDWIEIPSRYKADMDLFACKVEGESMNKVIPNGSICLFRKYTGGSRNGKIVLVQHIDIQESEFGAGYTVKEYLSKKKYIDGDLVHESIVLKPLTSNSGYDDIILTDGQRDSLRVIGIFECIL